MRLSVRTLAILAGLACPALADTSAEASGPAGRLVLAQETYQAAMAQGDAIRLVEAIRLARSVTLRPAPGWTRSTAGPAAGDQPAGRAAAPDPASPQVLAIAQALAGEDPALQDLVYDLDAQLPAARHVTATEARAELPGGQTDTWRIVLSGDVPAEFGLIGDGDTELGLDVTDEAGAPVCSVPPQTGPALCRFTPARNGFFAVTVSNPGTIRNSYRLIGG